MSAAEAERQLVVFSLHGEDYGLPITSVREITHYARPGATAAARGLICGMISWRGTVLPVADLSGRLGHTFEVGERTRILVLELEGGSLGLLVDAIVGVLSVAASQITSLPTAAGNDLGGEIAAVGERLIVLVDPEVALASALPPKPKPQPQPQPQPMPTPMSKPGPKPKPKSTPTTRPRTTTPGAAQKTPVKRTRRSSGSRPPAR